MRGSMARRRWWTVILLGALLWALSGLITVGYAQDGDTPIGGRRAAAPALTPPTSEERGDFLAMAEAEPAGWQVVLGVIGSLALVVVVVYSSLWVIRVVLLRRSALAGRDSLVRILERTFLAPNRSLYLVEVGERLFLLGATDSQVNMLAELDREELAEQAPFAARLAQASTQAGMRGTSWPEAGAALEGLRSAITRIRDLRRVEGL